MNNLNYYSAPGKGLSCICKGEVSYLCRFCRLGVSFQIPVCMCKEGEMVDLGYAEILAKYL